MVQGVEAAARAAIDAGALPAAVDAGLGRIVTLFCRSSTLYQIH